jgi:hypothetical protein
MTEALRAWSPWSPADALRWAVVGVLGHGMAVVAWYLATHEDTLDGQVPWASLAVAGFAMAAYADVTWLLQSRFAILQRRARLLPDDVPLAAASAVDDSTFVGGPGLGRFHRPSCPLAADRHWPTLDRHDALVAGRLPCGVCKP